MSEILFLGCGKMGSIIARNLLGGVSSNVLKISAIDPNCRSLLESQKIPQVNYFSATKELPQNYQADIIFIAIKPQEAQEILQKFSSTKLFNKNSIFISILAGKTLQFFTDIFGEEAKIVRSMPNLPIAYGQGIMAYFLNQNIKKQEEENLLKLLNNFGEVVCLKNEDDFDAITAIFGSGPAYIFYLQEIFTKIAIANKIDEEKAKKLVTKLFLGSALMAQNSEQDFAKLRESVTSKKGTTEAALQILMQENALENIFFKAIENAKKRAREL